MYFYVGGMSMFVFLFGVFVVVLNYQLLDCLMNFIEVVVVKVKEFIQDEDNVLLVLWVYIQGGGCFGFQYGFEFDENCVDDDLVVQINGVMLLVDLLSLQYLMGVEVDYIESFIGVQFVICNLNVKIICGCGSSFSM